VSALTEAMGLVGDRLVLRADGLQLGRLGLGPPQNFARPRILAGAGVPTDTTQPDGTRWMRTDAPDAFHAHYVSFGGVWTPFGWTAKALSPIAWFRGDVGSVSSWTDQSGNGNDAPAGSTAPTTTTLGGRPAFSFAGGGWFQNTTTSLVSAGSVYTVLAVAQALDASGGAFFTIRTGTSDSGSMALTSGGLTYVYTDAVVNVNFIADIHTELQSPFLFEDSYNGAGNAVSNRINRSNRATLGGAQGTETGATGFFIGKNNAGQPWNGVIAEVVVLARALTSGERAQWENYVLIRYGI